MAILRYMCVLLLVIIGAFVGKAQYGFDCFLPELDEKVFPLEYKPMAELCNEPTDLKTDTLNLAKMCSVEISEEDVTSFVEQICNEHLLKSLLKIEECISKYNIGREVCQPKKECVSRRSCCLRSLWKYYDCMVDYVGNLCGETASKAMRNTTKALHYLNRNLCMEF